VHRDRVQVEASRDLKALCHDMRHELAVILALAGVARADAGISDSSRRSLDHLVGNASRLADLMTEVVLAGTTPLVDVSATVTELVETVRIVCATTIVTAIEDTVCIAADAYQTRRAVMNLLDNALRAAGDDGVISVRLYNRFGQPVLEIEDSGQTSFSAEPGLASIGLSVVGEWVSDLRGTFRALRGRRGGNLVRIVMGPPLTAPAESL
jgi:signal transduction histidine kinase